MTTDMQKFKTKAQLAQYIERRKQDVEQYAEGVRVGRRNLDKMIESYYAQLADIAAMRKYLEQCDLPDESMGTLARLDVLDEWRAYAAANACSPFPASGNCWGCGHDLTKDFPDVPPSGCPKCHRSFCE